MNGIRKVQINKEKCIVNDNKAFQMNESATMSSK